MHIKTPFICQQVITQFQKLKLLTPEAFHFDEILLAKLCSETKGKGILSFLVEFSSIHKIYRLVKLIKEQTVFSLRQQRETLVIYNNKTLLLLLLGTLCQRGSSALYSFPLGA
jgi:hypothetical protein